MDSDTHPCQLPIYIANIVVTNIKMNLMTSREKGLQKWKGIGHTCGDAWFATSISVPFARMNFMVCECARLQHSLENKYFIKLSLMWVAYIIRIAMPYLVLLCYYEHMRCTMRRHSEAPCHEPITNPIIGVLGDLGISRHLARTEISQYILRTYVRVNSIWQKNARKQFLPILPKKIAEILAKAGP